MHQNIVCSTIKNRNGKELCDFIQRRLGTYEGKTDKKYLTVIMTKMNLYSRMILLFAIIKSQLKDSPEKEMQ